MAVEGSEKALKGYNVLSTLEGFKRTHTPEQVETALSNLPEDLRRALPNIKPFEFYPRRYFGEVVKVIAELYPDLDERAQVIESLGEEIARGATNTFLRLLMRMMTPRLLAGKIQTIWDKDHRGGRIDTDVSQLDKNIIAFVISDIEGFTYFNAVGVGWMRFGFTAMGCKDVEVRLREGSLTDELVDRINLEIRWR